MQLRDQYDWVVFGDHPGALLSAALAARLGLSVLVLPLIRPSRLSVVSKSGQVIDPETNFFLGLSRASSYPGLLAESLSKLGILPGEESLIETQESLPQILTPEHRIQLAAEFEAFETAIRREFGATDSERLGLLPAYRAAERDVLRYWNELPDRLTLIPGGKPKLGLRRLKDFRRKLLQSSSISRSGAGAIAAKWIVSDKAFSKLARKIGIYSSLPAIQGVWNAVVGSLEEDPLPCNVLQSLVLAKTGASFRGGATSYRDFLVRVAKRHGAVFPEKLEFKSLSVENGRFAGVVLDDDRKIAARGGAIHGWGQDFEGRVTRTGKSWLGDRTKKVSARGWRFTVALTVHAEAIAPGMENRMLWQETGAPPLEIEVADPQEYGVRSKDEKLIFLRTVLPFEQEQLQAENLRMVCARMLRQAMEIVPFLQFHIVRVFPDFRDHGFEGDLEEFYGFKALEEVPPNLLCYGAKGTGSRSGTDGLFILGEQAYPELGSFGPTVAALEAVAWIAHRSGLPGPFA